MAFQAWPRSFFNVLAGRQDPVISLRSDGNAMTHMDQCAQIMLPLQFINAAEAMIVNNRLLHLQRSGAKATSSFSRNSVSISPIVLLRVMPAFVSFTSRKLATTPANMFVHKKTTRFLEGCIIDRVFSGYRRKVKVRHHDRVACKYGALFSSAFVYHFQPRCRERWLNSRSGPLAQIEVAGLMH
jgi:hypothetical protein